MDLVDLLTAEGMAVRCSSTVPNLALPVCASVQAGPAPSPLEARQPVAASAPFYASGSAPRKKSSVLWKVTTDNDESVPMTLQRTWLGSNSLAFFGPRIA